MKSTDSFKQVIQNHLNQAAEKDSLFAETLKKENKNIDDCITYILNTVQKSGCNGFADDEIFGMAKHYYDEDVIEVGKPIKTKVVVNHKVEITEQDQEKAKKEAIEKLVEEEKQRILKKQSKPKKTTVINNTPSLFD
jgi:hypothetical protein